jgi:transglutaminase-like putative cysteine protease
MIDISNTELFKKLLAISIVFLVSSLTVTSLACSEPAFQRKNDAQQELDLLRGEHYLFVNATEDVANFHIRYSFPPDYQYQVPIMLEILNDSTADILHFEIENDTYEPNKVVDFLLGPMQKNDSVSIHFYCWVLVKNNEYSDLPEYVKIPKYCELPTETIPWLSATDVVQVQNILIKIKAYGVKGFTTDLLVLAQRIAYYVKWHRFPFYYLQLALGTLRGQDALTTLLRNGDCPGRSHLSCAFFRANGVPARVAMATKNSQFWYQMHFMSEYYCPGYGWILSEVHNAETPTEPKNQIIMRICSLEDENNTGHDFFFDKMTGVERWFWIDNEYVIPYYLDFFDGSKVNMFQEKELMTNTSFATTAFNVTEIVFLHYQQYLGKNLTDENLQHFQTALNYQKQAILSLKQSQEPNGYISFMNLALAEFEEIAY